MAQSISRLDKDLRDRSTLDSGELHAWQKCMLAQDFIRLGPVVVRGAIQRFEQRTRVGDMLCMPFYHQVIVDAFKAALSQLNHRHFLARDTPC